MTIRKGQDWGSFAVAPASLTTVASDAELGQLIVARQHAGDALQVVGLLGGDLMRTVGGSGDASRFQSTTPVPHLPVDLVHVIADGARETCFVAHLVARQRWWRGRITAVMNAQFIGEWDVVPRGHPNDGRVDVLEVSPDMTLQQRWMARSRLALGTHVPHPLITIVQRAEITIELDQPTPLWVDGVRWGSARHLELQVEPDAFIVCV